MTDQNRSSFTAQDCDNVLRKILKERDIATLQVANYGLLAFREFSHFVHFYGEEETEKLFKEYFMQLPDETKSVFISLENLANKYVSELRKLSENTEDI